MQAEAEARSDLRTYMVYIIYARMHGTAVPLYDGRSNNDRVRSKYSPPTERGAVVAR